MRVETTPLDPAGERGRGSWSLLLVAFVIVGLAIAKPWTGSGAGASYGADRQGPFGAIEAAPFPTPLPTPPPRGTPTVAPTPRSADDLAAERCNVPAGWRVYALETWRGQTVRHFIVVDPLSTPARGAADPRIPVVPLIGEAFTAVGYCAPVSGEGRPPADSTAQIWAVDGPALERAMLATRVEPQQPSVLMALFADPRPAVEPPGRTPGAPSTGTSWPQGRYVFAVVGPPGSGWERWFAVEVVLVPAASAP